MAAAESTPDTEWQSLDARLRPEDPQPEGWYAVALADDRVAVLVQEESLVSHDPLLERPAEGVDEQPASPTKLARAIEQPVGTLQLGEHTCTLLAQIDKLLSQWQEAAPLDNRARNRRAR